MLWQDTKLETILDTAKFLHYFEALVHNIILKVMPDAPKLCTYRFEEQFMKFSSSLWSGIEASATLSPAVTMFSTFSTLLAFWRLFGTVAYWRVKSLSIFLTTLRIASSKRRICK